MTCNPTGSSSTPSGTSPKASLVGLFVREDLSKPENRANLLLTAATGIAPFWLRFAEAVGLPPGCCVKPMIWSTGRPDLTAMDGDKVLAVFENENWGENALQKAAYERHIPARLIWIQGTGAPKDGTTWAQIRHMALAAHREVDVRQAVTLDLLVGAIDDILGLAERSRMGWLSVPDQLPDDPWFAEACSPVLAAQSGMVGAHAKAKGSASIRLLEPAALRKRTAHGVVLIMAQAAQPGRVFFPTPDHLRKHLAPALGAWIDEWETLLATADPAWKADGRGLVSFRVPTNMLPVAAVKGLFASLVERLR